MKSSCLNIVSLLIDFWIQVVKSFFEIEIFIILFKRRLWHNTIWLKKNPWGYFWRIAPQDISEFMFLPEILKHMLFLSQLKYSIFKLFIHSVKRKSTDALRKWLHVWEMDVARILVTWEESLVDSAASRIAKEAVLKYDWVQSTTVLWCLTLFSADRKPHVQKASP